MNSDLEQRVESFKEACRNAGIKLTHQRIEIFREIAARTDHPDAEAVFRGVQRRVPTVSLDTVYRTLWLLTDLGLLSTLGPRRESVRFDANAHPHHHYVCLRCGRTCDFDSKELEAIRVPARVRGFGTVTRTYVEVRGVCAECQSSSASSGEPSAAGE